MSCLFYRQVQRISGKIDISHSLVIMERVWITSAIRYFAGIPSSSTNALRYTNVFASPQPIRSNSTLISVTLHNKNQIEIITSHSSYPSLSSYAFSASPSSHPHVFICSCGSLSSPPSCCHWLSSGPYPCLSPSGYL